MSFFFIFLLKYIAFLLNFCYNIAYRLKNKKTVLFLYFLSSSLLFLKEFFGGMNNKLVELKNISKSFDGETVLSNLSLYINDKEFMTLLGPSGCGKTTTLRIIGGFESADQGDVYFDGVRINDVPPYKRNVNTVFQKYALFPHLNVYDNIAFGLRVAKVKEDEIKERVAEMLSLVNLRGFEKRNVSLLSGGQQQRVAIARALIN